MFPLLTKIKFAYLFCSYVLFLSQLFTLECTLEYFLLCEVERISVVER